MTLKTILLIDDDSNIKYIFEIMMGSEYSLEYFDKQADATEFLKNNDVHLIILDVHMPKQPSGLDYMKSIRVLTKAPIIMISSDDNMEIRAIAERNGASSYILKTAMDFDAVKRLIKDLTS